MLWFDVEWRYNTTRPTDKTDKGWLWFDVEWRYNTTYRTNVRIFFELWFDVEWRYNTTYKLGMLAAVRLWFDVEWRYNTTKHWNNQPCKCPLLIPERFSAYQLSITPYDTTTALSFSIVLWTHNLRCSEFIELTLIMVCPLHLLFVVRIGA